MTNVKTPKIKRLLMLLAILLLGACSTTIKLTSSPPGAKVFAGDKEIGTTPLELNEDILGEEIADGHLIYVKKPGFQSLWFWFPTGIRNMTATLNLQPFSIQKSFSASGGETVLSRLQLDVLADKLLNAQSDLLIAETPGNGLTELLTKYPSLGATNYLNSLSKLRNGDTDGAKSVLVNAIRLSQTEPGYIMLFKELGGDTSLLIDDDTKTDEEGVQVEEDGEEIQQNETQNAAEVDFQDEDTAENNFEIDQSDEVSNAVER